MVERRGRYGVINLAGAYLTAELPEELQPGDRLRLVVQEMAGERAVLALAPDPRRRRRSGEEPSQRDDPPQRDRADEDEGDERPGSLDVYG